MGIINILLIKFKPKSSPLGERMRDIEQIKSLEHVSTKFHITTVLFGTNLLDNLFFSNRGLRNLVALVGIISTQPVITSSSSRTLIFVNSRPTLRNGKAQFPTINDQN